MEMREGRQGSDPAVETGAAADAGPTRYIDPDAERRRRDEAREGQSPWYQWGPYLSERQWGTVREDYSADGSAWQYFPHDHARSRAYRWGEDGLLGISDRHQRLCFALALWNGADPILKERLFGLTGPEGNHGEDVKEYYYYLDATPTHSYLRALYRYPQRAYPYAELVRENQRRGRFAPEYELLDTGVLAEHRYFDVTVEYAKAAPEDIVIRITVTNHGPDAAPLHVLPTLWFRNTWAWGRRDHRPVIDAIETREASAGGTRLLRAAHHELGEHWLACGGAPDLLVTENETNAARLWNLPNSCPYTKDGINDAVVQGASDRVNPA
ncbi:MAG TPA: glucosidase, partial [bacterium]|nr:glucosidase [bacterium]